VKHGPKCELYPHFFELLPVCTHSSLHHKQWCAPALRHAKLMPRTKIFRSSLRRPRKQSESTLTRYSRVFISLDHFLSLLTRTTIVITHHTPSLLLSVLIPMSLLPLNMIQPPAPPSKDGLNLHCKCNGKMEGVRRSNKPSC
jgi:hypothetical protein